MFVKQLSTIMLAGALLLTGCAGRAPATQAELPQPPQRLVQADAQVNRPEGLPRPESPRLGNRAGDRQPLAGDGERQAGQALPVPVNGEQRAAIPDYDAAQMLGIGMAAVKGDISKKAEFTAAVEKAKIDSPRGTFTLSKAHNPVQDFYLRQVGDKENKLVSIASKALADPARGCKM